MGKNNYNFNDIILNQANAMKEIIENSNANQQVISSQIAEATREAKAERAEFRDIVSSTAYNLNSTVNQGVEDCISATRESEGRLSKKIDTIKGKTLGVLDWITILIVTVLGGLGGWFFSNCMIKHEFAAWVDRVDTVEYIRDAAGNITDITNTVTSSIVWPTVIVTIVLFAIVGMTVSYAIVDSISDN